MTVAASRPAPTGAAAHLPAPGAAVWLEGLPGAPWRTTVVRGGREVIVVRPPRRGDEEAALDVGHPCVVAYMLREVPCEVPATVGPRDDEGRALRLTGPAVRLQRRDDVRVPVRLLTQARVTGDGGAPVAAVTENLSAGGALLRTEAALQAGTAVRLDLSCGGGTGDLALPAIVLRSDPLGSGARPFRVAVTFADIPRAVEDRVVRFLFERQRELRRRERERGGPGGARTATESPPGGGRSRPVVG